MAETRLVSPQVDTHIWPNRMERFPMRRRIVDAPVGLTTAVCVLHTVHTTTKTGWWGPWGAASQVWPGSQSDAQHARLLRRGRQSLERRQLPRPRCSNNVRASCAPMLNETAHRVELSVVVSAGPALQCAAHNGQAYVVISASCGG